MVTDEEDNKDLNVVLFALKETSELPSSPSSWSGTNLYQGLTELFRPESLDDLGFVDMDVDAEQQLHQQCFRQEETKAGNKKRAAKIQT
jgi:hypothetical protein